MLIQAVHEVTSGLIKLVSSEEFRPSARTLIFSASVTILISTDGIHKDIMWTEILECKNVCVTAVPPLTLYKGYLYHMQSIYLHDSCQLLVSKCFIQLSIYLPSLTHNLTTAVYFHKLAFLITFRYDDINMSSIDIK